MDNSLSDGTSTKYFDKYGVNLGKKPLGEGSYGRVYAGIFPGTNEKIAVKVVVKNAQGIPSTTLREVALLKSFDHANIVRLLKVEQDETNIYCILEYLDRTLADVIENEIIDSKKIKMFMHQILSASEYLHDRNVVHGDLKPNTMMTDVGGNLLKVVGFGEACLLNVGGGSLAPNPSWYRAPELLMGSRNCSCSVDMWSIGCIFAEMMNGKTPPFVPEKKDSLITCILKKLGTPTEQSWPGVTALPYYPTDNSHFEPQDLSESFGHLDQEGLDLLSKLLVLNPQERISASDALEHPYFH